MRQINVSPTEEIKISLPNKEETNTVFNPGAWTDQQFIFGRSCFVWSVDGFQFVAESEVTPCE